MNTANKAQQKHILNHKNDCINCGQIEMADQLDEVCPALPKAQHTAQWHEASTGTHQGLVIDQDGNNIAVVYDKANTPLISASPTMLMALEKAVKRLIELEGSIKNGEKVENIEEIELIEQAIAKARGE